MGQVGGGDRQSNDPYNGTRIWLRTFYTADDASRAYEVAARRLRGSKAKVNFSVAAGARPIPPGT